MNRSKQLLLRPRPLQIVTHLRPLRGGAQAHLIQADDGHFYAIKARNNAQHRRILINEWIATAYFQAAGLPTPRVATIEVSPETLIQFPALRLQIGWHMLPFETGLCFGSRYLVDPRKANSYDFLPPALLDTLDTNLFIGALVADQWLNQTDSRQAVFTVRDGEIVTSFIDHGFIWNAQYWEIRDALPAVYLPGPRLYRSMSDSEIGGWIDRLRALPVQSIFDRAFADMPAQWLEPDEADLLQNLIGQMKCRLRHLPTRMHYVAQSVRQWVATSL